jgi:hypothetical protein
MQEPAKFRCPQDKPNDDLSAVHGLPFPIDYAPFDQGHDPIGTHLAMDTQVAPISQTSQHCIGNATDSQL